MSLLQTADVERILAELSDSDPCSIRKPTFSSRSRSKCNNFGLHEGRTIAGGEALQWDERAGDGTKKGREEPITLRGDYTFHWRRYSNCLTHPRVKPFEDELTRYAEFRYLLVRVPPRE
jgi:allophanate hydrolase subunit 2